MTLPLSVYLWRRFEKKIEKAPDSPQYIQTHIGVGYRMIKTE